METELARQGKEKANLDLGRDPRGTLAIGYTGKSPELLEGRGLTWVMCLIA